MNTEIDLLQRADSIIFVAVFTVAVAQLVRALVCGTKGRGFEPHQLPPINPS